MEVVDRVFDEVNSLSQKPIMYGVLGMLLGFYGPRLNPNLPTNIKNLFENSLFRFLIIAVIICVSTKDLQLALMIGIGLMLGISFANSQDVTEKFSEQCGEQFINLSNDISEFYSENFQDKEDEKNKEDEKEDKKKKEDKKEKEEKQNKKKDKKDKKKDKKGKQPNPKKPVTQQKQDSSVPEASTEKDEGFNNINKFDNLDQFFGYGGSATGSPLVGSHIEKERYVNYQDEEADPVEMFAHCNKKNEESDPVEMFSNCHRNEESDQVEMFAHCNKKEESDEALEGFVNYRDEEADDVEEGEDEPEEADDVEEGEDEPEEDEDVENFIGNRPSQYESQLRRTIANYSM